MNEIAIGKRVRLIPSHPLFKCWTGKRGIVTQREWEGSELQYRVLLDDSRNNGNRTLETNMPGEGYLFRRVEIEEWEISGMRMRNDELVSKWQLQLDDNQLESYLNSDSDTPLNIAFTLSPNWEFNQGGDSGLYTPVVDAYIDGKKIAVIVCGNLAFTAPKAEDSELKALFLAKKQIGVYMKRMQPPLVALFDAMFRHCDATFDFRRVELESL